VRKASQPNPYKKRPTEEWIKANPDAHAKSEALEAEEIRKRVEKVKKSLKEF